MVTERWKEGVGITKSDAIQVINGVGKNSNNMIILILL
jgi:hypothetical protein